MKEKDIRKAGDDIDSLSMGYQMGKGVSLNRPCGTTAGNHAEIGETKLLKGVS